MWICEELANILTPTTALLRIRLGFGVGERLVRHSKSVTQVRRTQQCLSAMTYLGQEVKVMGSS